FHDFVGPRDRVEDGGVEITSLRVGLPTVNDLLGIDQRRKPFDRGRTDDAGVVRVVLGVHAVEFDDSLFAFGYEMFRDGLMNDSVARRSAPLSSPSHRTPDNFLGGIRNVRRLIDDRWVLSAQFKQHWSDIFSRRSHHHFSHTYTPGEEYE